MFSPNIIPDKYAEPNTILEKWLGKKLFLKRGLLPFIVLKSIK